MGQDGASYDYIVVGTGSAGCVIANRLSADPARRVCVIEAGPSDRTFPTRILSTVPVGSRALLPQKTFNWSHVFTGADALSGRTIPCPTGRVVGGSSVLNGMIYMRGHRSDYDDWAALGNAGWGYDDVLPFFKGHENREAGADAFHGSGGELNVAPLRSPNPLSLSFVETARTLQLGVNDDFNGSRQDGFGLHEVTQKNGERWSSARAFLQPVLHRRNLELMCDTTVQRVVVEAGRAVGVEVRRGGETSLLLCAGEIVLSAGAINSPQILVQSGIGPADVLASLGVPVVCDLAGVGQNLQDHPAVTVQAQDRSRRSHALNRRTMAGMVFDVFRYMARRRGVLACNLVEAGGFFRTSLAGERPDLQLIFMPTLRDPKRIVSADHGFGVIATLLRPESRGYLQFRSADGESPPVLHPNFLDAAADIDRLVEGVRLIRRMLAASPLARHVGNELQPGAGVTSDEDLRSFAQKTVATIFHPVGTCRMGPGCDARAVVDAQLRVKGVRGLLVADASIMPTIVGGNTNAPAMMIGERAADFMLRKAA